MRQTSTCRLLTGAGTLLAVLLLSACGGGPAPTEEATRTEPAAEPAAAATLDKIFYADTWTWPFQPGQLAHMTRGKYYVPVQDEDKIAVIDPDAPDDIKFVDTEFVQPHHTWLAPGMRYGYVNFQSEGKGDHDAYGILDTQTDQVTYGQTGTNDPFHGAFSPTENVYVTGDLDTKAGRVHLIDTTTHEVVATIETTGTRTRDVNVSGDGRYAFVGHQGYDPEAGDVGPVDVIDLAERKVVKSLGAGRCRSGKMSNDRSLVLYSCDRANTIIAIDVANLEIKKEIELPEDSGPFNISFRGDDKYAYVGLKKSGKLGIVDIESLELVKAIDSGKDTNSTYIHPNGKLAVTTNDGTDAHVSIVDVENNEIIDTIETAGKGTHNGQWSPDGRWFLITNRLGESTTLLAYDEAANKISWKEDIRVGFGANGVMWAPYFCGVDELTPGNVQSATNAPANEDGSCAQET